MLTVILGFHNMNLRSNISMKEAIEKNCPVYIVYENESKEIVSWYAFGEKLAKVEANDRCAKFGPDTYDYAKWEQYVKIRDRFEQHKKQLEEIERKL